MKSKLSVFFMGRKDDPCSEELSEYLRLHCDGYTERWSDGIGSKLEHDINTWEGDLIVCFRSHFILPQSLIEKARIAAINFHPGPPNYRGAGCINWALYDGARQYGCTAHLMDSTVDNGRILDVRSFEIDEDESLKNLLERTHAVMLDQAFSVLEVVLNGESKEIEDLLTSYRGNDWSGPIRRIGELDHLQEISPNIDKHEFERIYRATRIDGFGPVLKIHGRKFFVADD